MATDYATTERRYRDRIVTANRLTAEQRTIIIGVSELLKRRAAK